jgi:hypothetical protein
VTKLADKRVVTLNEETRPLAHRMIDESPDEAIAEPPAGNVGFEASDSIH